VLAAGGWRARGCSRGAGGARGGLEDAGGGWRVLAGGGWRARGCSRGAGGARGGLEDAGGCSRVLEGGWRRVEGAGGAYWLEEGAGGGWRMLVVVAGGRVLVVHVAWRRGLEGAGGGGGGGWWMLDEDAEGGCWCMVDAGGSRVLEDGTKSNGGAAFATYRRSPRWIGPFTGSAPESVQLRTIQRNSVHRAHTRYTHFTGRFAAGRPAR